MGCRRKTSATMRSGLLTHTQEARNNGYAQETKATSDAALLFIRRHEFLIRMDAPVEHIGREDEAGFAPRFLLDLRLLDADRCLDVPLHRGSRIFAETSFARVMLRTDQLASPCPVRTTTRAALALAAVTSFA